LKCKDKCILKNKKIIIDQLCLKHVKTRKKTNFVEDVDIAIKLVIVLRFVDVEWYSHNWMWLDSCMVNFALISYGYSNPREMCKLLDPIWVDDAWLQCN